MNWHLEEGHTEYGSTTLMLKQVHAQPKMTAIFEKCQRDGHEGEITNCIYEGKLGVFCPEGDCKKLTSILLNNEKNYFKDCQELRNKWLKTKSRKYQAKAFFDLLNRA